MRKYYINTKEKECFPFDEWITKLEMRAFGWADKDHVIDYLNEYDVTVDWERSTAKVNQRMKRYAVFKRVEPYSGNFLFNILEFFMKIQSWIRRKLIILFWFIDVLLFGIGFIYLFGGKGMNEYIALGLYLFAFIYAPSLVISLLGFLTRVIFRIDAKLKDSLEANGYMREQDF
ncbi:MAG: hypothetical protein NC033_00490 [Clostridiales bacterium]|nr:hypothetical protein [Clostridiales bacterium]